MLAAPADADLLALARGAAVPEGVEMAASVVDGLLVVRARARQSRLVMAAFTGVWRVVRPLVMGRPACAPRIWAT
jgi:urease accessory protein